MRAVAHQAGAYPSFCSIKQLGVFPLSVASLAGLPPVLSLPVPTYMGGEGHCEFKVSSSRTLTQCPRPGAHFSKALETFRAHKAISGSSVPKNREVYTPETPCMKRTSAHMRTCE